MMQVIADLQQRLNMVRPFNPPLEGVAFQYGVNTNYLKTVLEFWKNKYSWKDRQVYLNSFPQFTTEIAGLKIHFIHVKPAGTKPGVSTLYVVYNYIIIYGFLCLKYIIKDKDLSIRINL